MRIAQIIFGISLAVFILTLIAYNRMPPFGGLRDAEPAQVAAILAIAVSALCGAVSLLYIVFKA